MTTDGLRFQSTKNQFRSRTLSLSKRLRKLLKKRTRRRRPRPPRRSSQRSPSKSSQSKLNNNNKSRSSKLPRLLSLSLLFSRPRMTPSSTSLSSLRRKISSPRSRKRRPRRTRIRKRVALLFQI